MSAPEQSGKLRRRAASRTAGPLWPSALTVVVARRPQPMGTPATRVESAQVRLGSLNSDATTCPCWSWAAPPTSASRPGLKAAPPPARVSAGPPTAIAWVAISCLQVSLGLSPGAQPLEAEVGGTSLRCASRPPTSRGTYDSSPGKPGDRTTLPASAGQQTK